MDSNAGGAILGINADFHDASAAVIVDGTVLVAAEEERFSRVKHDPALPIRAMHWALEEVGIGKGGLASVAVHGKPFSVYERVLATHARVGPAGLPTLRRAVSSWSRSKLWLGARIQRSLRELGIGRTPVKFVEHHQSHAASAFYPSPFQEAAIITFDAVGEWATSSIAHGRGHRFDMLVEQRFPDSLGLFYSAMTQHCGFEVNDGEYKLMGLAPFGNPTYVDILRDQVIEVADTGAVHLDQKWFSYRRGDRMTSNRLDELLDGPARAPGTVIGQREANLARSAQVILEDAVLATARHARELTGETNLCMAGGVALNCVANAVIRDRGPFDEVWVQPAAGDAGGALGAALWEHHQRLGEPRDVKRSDGMSGSMLGPRLRQGEIASVLEAEGVPHEVVPDIDELDRMIASALAAGSIVGWVQGRMEFGPRALGCRSILADPRNPFAPGRINAAVKGREGFRPFAPAVLEEQAERWFLMDGSSPYMLFTASVHPDVRIPDHESIDEGFTERLNVSRSMIPACTHVDHSARVQTVSTDRSPRFHHLISQFHAQTGCPVLLNTSFNRSGEPMVRTPLDALRCFIASGLDVLVLEQTVVWKRELGA